MRLHTITTPGVGFPAPHRCGLGTACAVALVLLACASPAAAQTGVSERADAQPDILVVSIVNGEGAEVWLDEIPLPPLGSNGVLVYRAPGLAGPHELRIEKAGFEARTETITLQPGRNELPSYTLIRASSGFDIPWLPILLGLGALVLAGLGVVAFLRRPPREKKPAGPAVPTTAQQPDHFDRFQIERELGRGGMATVYLARDRTTRERVALKLMHLDLMNDVGLVRKFLNEGEALYRIQQTDAQAPVVRPYYHGRENGRSGGRPFVAVEYLDGDTLLRYLQNHERLDSTTAVDILEQLCCGLKAAHANGIYHRDLTPDNIIVTASTPRFKVKLIDFGVAKHEFTVHQTLDGTIVGKPPYMSPEQCRGQSIDHRSDIYSLGVLMYTMLTGTPPFVNPNPLLVMKMHESEPVRPLPEDIPAPVSNLVYWMLRKDLEERPADVDAVLRAIYDLNLDITRTYQVRPSD